MLRTNDGAVISTHYATNIQMSSLPLELGTSRGIGALRVAANRRPNLAVSAVAAREVRVVTAAGVGTAACYFTRGLRRPVQRVLAEE